MKKYLLFFAAAIFALAACEKTNEEENKNTNENGQEPQETVVFTLTSDSVVNLGSESEISTVKFTAPAAWTIKIVYPTEVNEYVVLSQTSGEAGENEVKVTVQSLPEGEVGRYFSAVITCGSAQKEVVFYQGSVFIIDYTWFEFDTAGGNAEFNVISNLDYTVTTYDVFDWAPVTYDKETGAGVIAVAASNAYDSRTAYVKFTVPDIQVAVYDYDDNGDPYDTGETTDYVVRVYVYQEGNVKVAWTQDFFWTMFSTGGRHSIALVGDYFIVNTEVDASYSTGGVMVFKKSDGSYVKNIAFDESFTGVTTDDAGNVILTSGGDYPIDENTWALIAEDQTPLKVYVIKAADAKSMIDSGTAPTIEPIITWYNTCYGYGVSNVRVTGDVTGTAVIDVVSAAYQESDPTNRVVAWQVTGGKAAAEPVIRTVPADDSIWTPNDLVAKHITTDVNGPLYYMGYDGNYQLWYAASMTADWQAVLDSGSSWIEGYQCLDILEWNGHKYLGLIGETYFAWYGWGSLPSYLWIINIDDPTAPVAVAKTACDISGNDGTWQYGATADLEMVVEGNDLAVYCVDAGISTYHKVVYPAL